MEVVNGVDIRDIGFNVKVNNTVNLIGNIFSSLNLKVGVMKIQVKKVSH